MKQIIAPAVAEPPVNVFPEDNLTVVSAVEARYVSFPALPLNSLASRSLKRAFDIVASILLIIFVLSWAFPLLALVIRVNSRGPVLFLQKRNKKGERQFTCLKLRTMFVDTGAAGVTTSEVDSRVTGVGKFLRYHHLDELPQLLNVLWGDMSLIGPRPHMISDDDHYSQLLHRYYDRYLVRPGITGLAQVRGHVGTVKNTQQMGERLKHDLYYIHNWTPIMDLKIVYLTFFRLLGHKG